MQSTCTLFFMVSMTQHLDLYYPIHYMNILLILLQFNSCCQNKLISVSVSVSVMESLQCTYDINQMHAVLVILKII